MATAGRPLIALATLPWHVLAVRFADRVGKRVRTAPRDALLAESVPAEARGRAFGFHRAADPAGAVLGPLVASGLLLAFPGWLRLVFALAVVPGVVAVLVLWLRVREFAPAAAEATEAAPDVSFRGLGPVFPRYLLVLVLFTLGNATDAFLLLRAQQLGVAAALLPLLWGALHVSKSAWSVVGGIAADRFGARRTIALGWLVYAAVYAGFAAAGVAWQAWTLFLVYGLFFGLTEGPEKALVAGFAPAEARGRAFGAYHFSIGIAALPASVIFGVIWEGLGAPAAFLFGGGMALAAAVLLLVLLPRSGVIQPPAAAG